RYLTQRWRSLIREVDDLARIGGEEFVVLMPETDVEGAMEAAERLRAATAAEPVSTAAGNLYITVSIGLALALPEEDGLEQVLQRADRALYRAKAGGRNRCEPDRPDAEPAAQAAPAG
ncbi:MAG TPA: GGDEF domain-containing protein, partial [Arenicellales bacterium]|nr:GGDEF domain-containing protein [Arenicellales bacterium]